jgi:carbamoyltransferase
MGLAPYGRPVYRDQILDHLVDLKPDGSLWLNMEYFNYCQGLTMTNSRFDELFGGPPRQPEARLDQRHMDLAASIQQVTEEAMLRMAREAHRLTGEKHLVLAGGVALNCVANGRILREGPFEDVWIQPAAGDAGGALGAALFVWHQLMQKPRTPQGKDTQKGSYLGPRFSVDEIEAMLTARQIPARKTGSEQELLEEVANLLAAGKIVGWFHGRMEFGPRALGARSILADPRNTAIQSELNLKIKFRESFRPFAPCVLQERVGDYFEMRPGQRSDYMLLVAPVREEHRLPLSEADQCRMNNDPDLRTRVNIPRSRLPAITHVDYSARVQTVNEPIHGRFYRLLKEFEGLTGCPVLVNTSFNIRGEPIVCAPEEALRCFLATDMDVLVLQDHILYKEQMSQTATAAERERYLGQFKPD